MNPEEFAAVLASACLAYDSLPCEETEEFIKRLVTGFLAEDDLA